METAPQRIQRKRTKGWRIPENTVCVGRGSKWGNPFWIIGSGSNWVIFCAEVKNENHNKIAQDIFHNEFLKNTTYTTICAALNISVEMYSEYSEKTGLKELAKEELKNKNIACWCKLTAICHGDMLLKIANEL